jgi:hypothetical protein
MTAERAGPLDAPPEHWAQAQHPGLQSQVLVTRNRKVTTAEEAAAVVDCGRREAALVGIDADHIANL